MTDENIIDLYLARDENAIRETQAKYDSYCKTIARNILGDEEDAEECVNDTLARAWSKIPPIVPRSLKAFLGKVVRDVALSRYRENHAKKRYHGMDLMLDELDECIPSEFDVHASIEQKELSELINSWLAGLTPDDRALFVKRYYFAVPLGSLARLWGITEKQMAQRMYRLRGGLKKYLQSKGVTI